MGIPADLLPEWLLHTGIALYLVGILIALRTAPWRALRSRTVLNLALGAITVLAALWRLEAGLLPGLSFHFLMVTTVTLLLGWSLAVVVAFWAELAVTLIGDGSLLGVGVNAILSGLLPASLTYFLYHLYRRHSPQHLFVYIFGVAFFGGAAVAIVTVCARVSLLALVGVYSLDRMSSEYLPFLPLYAFPEAVLNGMLVTVFAVFRPTWMKTLNRDTIAPSI